ncbi:MAG: hypothetical protein RMJ44_02725 [Cytophagales bacterium]|nr:hypothetical protein [Bernardetiaceae bacterium]MDW8209976.1 hypothetical protein [Cytophagales bacterium]
MGLAKIFWIFSLLAFLAVLLVTYIYMPETVAILFDELGLPFYFVSRDNYFYFALLVCLAFNVAILLLAASINRLPSWMLPTPKRRYWSLRENRPRFAKRFSNWTKGIAFFLNLLLCLWLINILKGNDSQVDFNTKPLSYLFASLLVVWIGMYFVIFGIYVEKMD